MESTSKTEQGSGVKKNSKKIVFLVLGIAFLLLLISGAYYLYKTTGYKEYRESLAYLNSLSPEQKDRESKMFFANANKKDLSGGILATTTRKSVWIWTEGGLKYFRLTNDASLFIIKDHCAEAAAELEKVGNVNQQPLAYIPDVLMIKDIASSPYVDQFLHISKWRRMIHPGNYIQVRANPDGTIKSATVTYEFDGPRNWVVCGLYIE